MGLLTWVVLVVSVAFVAYAHPAMLRSILSGWLIPDGSNEQPTRIEIGHKDGEPTKTSAKEDADDDTVEGELTPKAVPADPTNEVPVFTLSGDEDSSKEKVISPPSFPAANSAQRASAMPPPPKPSGGTPSLMLPPTRPNPGLRPGAAASLRIPSTGPLPNRGLPANSQQRASSSLAPNAAIKTSNARNKVVLSPGHSPMDWAALIRSGNLSGVATFQRVTPGQLKAMTGRKGKPAWSIWQGKVYNITPYLPFHPGGEAELMKAAGRDGTKLFMDVHPWVNWENMLSACLVGVMVPEDYGMSGESSLEDMD